MDLLSLTTQVLRDPDAVAAREGDAHLARVAPALLVLAVGGAMVLGVAVGASAGPLQSIYAAVKMPVLLLGPPLVALPLVHAFAEACNVPVRWSRLGLAALAGLARSGLLAAAAAPLLWLPFSLDAEYHFEVLLFVLTFSVAALPALGTVARAIPTGGRLRFLAVPAILAALALLTAQTGWVLRPFVSRPQGVVAFLRPVESDIFSALGATSESAVGIYGDDWTPTRSGLWRERGAE